MQGMLKVRSGEADGFVSAGSTGATLAVAEPGTVEVGDLTLADGANLSFCLSGLSCSRLNATSLSAGGTVKVLAEIGASGLAFGEFTVADFGSGTMPDVTFEMAGPNADRFNAPVFRDGKLILRPKPRFCIRLAGRAICGILSALFA